MTFSASLRRIENRVVDRSLPPVLRSACCRAQHAEVRRLDSHLLARRELIASTFFVGVTLKPSGAHADVIRDYVERSQRPEMTPEQAVVMLLDARGVLYELKGLAATAKDSDERFRARSLLPGMAKRLREVGKAAPVLVAQVTGSEKRSTVSKEYGGEGDEAAVAVPVYRAIGQVITISGRTIRKEAQASPEFAENAITKINDLLALLPEGEIERAQQLRKGRLPRPEIKRSEVPLNVVA